MLYMSSVDSTAPLASMRCGGAALAALTCAAAAMTAKETGFTILAAFVLYEMLPFAVGPPVVVPARPGVRRRRPWLKSLARLCATFGLALGYLAARSAIIGGDTLVHIYRKVENPLAFYSTLQERLLATAHQHWLYAYLMLAPVQLSADWSFSCIKPVAHLSDVRNVGSLLLYAAAAVVVLQAAPWRWRCDEQLRTSRVRAYILLALSVAPFVPAANVRAPLKLTFPSELTSPRADLLLCWNLHRRASAVHALARLLHAAQRAADGVGWSVAAPKSCAGCKHGADRHAAGCIRRAHVGAQRRLGHGGDAVHRGDARVP